MSDKNPWRPADRVDLQPSNETYGETKAPQQDKQKHNIDTTDDKRDALLQQMKDNENNVRMQQQHDDELEQRMQQEQQQQQQAAPEPQLDENGEYPDASHGNQPSSGSVGGGEAQGGNAVSSGGDGQSPAPSAASYMAGVMPPNADDARGQSVLVSPDDDVTSVETDRAALDQNAQDDAPDGAAPD